MFPNQEELRNTLVKFAELIKPRKKNHNLYELSKL